MNPLKLYIAGKVSSNSVFGTSHWRDSLCKELSEKSGLAIISLDPAKCDDDFVLDQNNAELIVGRCCHMIQLADVVIVNLTDDISVGGSQEMLIAKRYSKPLIGIASRGGKFNKDTKEMLGKTYHNYLDPFVKISCDHIVEDISGAAALLQEFMEKKQQIKDITVLDKARRYYEKEHHAKDKILHVQDTSQKHL